MQGGPEPLFRDPGWGGVGVQPGGLKSLVDYTLNTHVGNYGTGTGILSESENIDRLVHEP